MFTIYEVDIDNDLIKRNLTKIQSCVFQLLPMREEGKDWIKPLETIILELSGMYALFPQLENFLALLCKLQGLLEGKNEIDFMFYRRSIFECCNLIDKIRNSVQ